LSLYGVLSTITISEVVLLCAAAILSFSPYKNKTSTEIKYFTEVLRPRKISKPHFCHRASWLKE